MAIQISSTTVIDNSRNLTNIANATTAATANTYVLRGADGKICSDSVSLPTSKGSAFEGGILMSCSGGVYWIVSPFSAEVARPWASVNDAATRAQQVSGCTGWFVPNQSQLQNPGNTFRVFWDRFSTLYWSTTQYPPNPALACGVNFSTGTPFYDFKTRGWSVRAFRCVTY